jgi:hypothetical protein
MEWSCSASAPSGPWPTPGRGPGSARHGASWNISSLSSHIESSRLCLGFVGKTRSGHRAQVHSGHPIRSRYTRIFGAYRETPNKPHEGIAI